MTRDQARAPQVVDEPQEVAAFCARPGCDREFRKLIARGRPQAYCSDTCRRSAEREVRRLRSRLAHFEAMVDQHRRMIAAYDREADEGSRDVEEATQRLRQAVARASGVLRFVENSDQPLADELRVLHSAAAALTVG